MSDSSSTPKKIKKNRCAVCKKKVGLLGFSCACSTTLTFCTAHRLPENHNCNYDHGEHSKYLLSTKLIKVENEKVIKI